MKIFNHNVSKRDLVPPIILRLLGKEVQYTKKYYYSDKLNSCSQYNEDLIIDVIFQCKDNGFYVDVGANHPEIFSNSKRFYDRGWHGINIEPNPQLHKFFCSNRERDINLNIGIGTEKGKMPFYLMTSDTLSSFDKGAAMKSGKIHGAKLKDVKEIEMLPLSEVFDKYLNNHHIDFLSIDTEGYDLNVLISNDWTRYRPSLVVIETGEESKKVSSFFIDKDYTLIFHNYTNAFFLDNNFNPSVMHSDKGR